MPIYINDDQKLALRAFAEGLSRLTGYTFRLRGWLEEVPWGAYRADGAPHHGADLSIRPRNRMSELLGWGGPFFPVDRFAKCRTLCEKHDVPMVMYVMDSVGAVYKHTLIWSAPYRIKEDAGRHDRPRDPKAQEPCYLIKPFTKLSDRLPR